VCLRIHLLSLRPNTKHTRQLTSQTAIQQDHIHSPRPLSPLSPISTAMPCYATSMFSCCSSSNTMHPRRKQPYARDRQTDQMQVVAGLRRGMVCGREPEAKRSRHPFSESSGYVRSVIENSAHSLVLEKASSSISAKTRSVRKKVIC
jgi:hypothetical protein